MGTKRPADFLPSYEPPVLTPEDYHVRLGPGWILNDGTYDRVPQTSRRKRNVPHPAYVSTTFESMFGLNTLQLAHDAPIHPCAMDVAAKHVWQCLSSTDQAQIEIAHPCLPDLWAADQATIDAVWEEMKAPEFLDEGQYFFYPELKQKRWVIWPIWVEDEWGKDWVLLAWYAQARPETPETFDQVRTYAIYDPRRDPTVDSKGRHPLLTKRRDRISQRLRQFLERGGFNLSIAQLSDAMCCPMPLQEYTSGERCFAAIKQLSEHLADSRLNGITDYIFPNLSRRVFPYQYRVEMAGINAWVLMGAFDFNARIAVECIPAEANMEVVADGIRRVVKPYDLASSMKTPGPAAEDYLLP
ncbi:hypothetical protein GGR54DRAFT_598126 [Hypoxylon sp. NC1633]|nr:hypothetical protein GGR54DRAFT_598126 [Hypoxylon sp. NC1633]